MILAVINDMAEFQNARYIFSDTANGNIHFVAKMYAQKYALQFTVTNAGEDRCNVKIEISKETLGAERQIRLEFALLEAMLNE